MIGDGTGTHIRSRDRETGSPDLRIKSLYLIILVVLVLAANAIAEDPDPDENSTIRIAIFQMAPDEGNFTANHAAIEEAITFSADNGADWFITPEMAESGYEFAEQFNTEQLYEFPSPWFTRLQTISRDKNITMFIGFPERFEGRYYNAVAVIDRNGTISGVHQKNEIMSDTLEGWASPGNATPLIVDGHRVGYYICADIANEDITNRYIVENVEIMLSSAAWYPEPPLGPDAYWKKVTSISRVPLVIANTVWRKGYIDSRRAESGVYRDGKAVYRLPGSSQVIAFVDWNYQTGEIRQAGEPVFY